MSTENNNLQDRSNNQVGTNALKSTIAPTLTQIRLGNGYLKIGDVGASVKSCRILLDSKGYSCNTTSKTYDATLKSVVNTFQKAVGLAADGNLGQATLAVLEDTISDTGWLVDGVVNITAGKLARLGFTKEVLKPTNVRKLNNACKDYSINTKTKVRHFLAQGMVETDKGATFTEYIYIPGDSSSYADYAPFCGAGFLQLTHKYAYEEFRKYMKASKYIDDAKITTPSTYATQHVAQTYPYESAGWFWDVYKDLNTEMDGWASLSAEDTVKNLTIKIKGSSSTYTTRLSYYEKSKKIFK